MKELSIWDLNNVHIKIKEDFLKEINQLIHTKFKSKEKFYNKLTNRNITYKTFRNIMKYSYYKIGFYAPLNVFIDICKELNIDKEKLQYNIESYKSANGYNIIEDPILPIKITPIFDMILAHNIADGTVINPKRRRQPYFGYRQFNKKLRLAYVHKLENIFGKIKYKNEYFIESTRPYCPVVLSSAFFNYYKLNLNSFLSKSARLPTQIFYKNKEHLLAVLIAFIIDEGNIDSTNIIIRLKNIRLTEDLYKICGLLNYDSTFKCKGEYGALYIKRSSMKKFFKEYKDLVKKYPAATLGDIETKIENGLRIYKREIYKSKRNKKIILNMIKIEDLTVNQIAERVNMTRQGVRWHINKLEREGYLMRKGIYNGNIIYSYR